jgi:16S rRNA processing protein RimM
MEPVPQWIVLAHILRPQGRKGEVLADLFTDFPERFGDRPSVWLATEGHAASGLCGPTSSPPRAATVADYWLPVGRNAGRVVLRFAGVDSIEQAERLAGLEVIVPLDQRVPLDEGAAYISDLAGCTVFDQGIAVGVVASVEFPTTPDGTRRLDDAAPLLAVTSPEGDELLIPFANAFLVELDVSAKAIRMALPEGLLQINR